MPYIALARKYRPQKISDLFGQNVLKQILTTAIEKDKLHHAFLLYGTRGIGKTTTARIIAKSLNCQKQDRPTIDPCLECVSCKSITNGNSPDVIEFDAASNTGVDSIRKIIDECRYPNSFSRYKVYIIDEVHMLSNSAFNAFLKLLEEPSENIKFIFATTEIKKIPMTILSRCQKLMLASPTKDEIKSYLEFVLNTENIKYEDEALKLISRHANGSFRDSLSLTETVLSYNNNVNFKNASEILAVPNEELCFELFSNIIMSKTQDALSTINKLNQSNITDILTNILSIINDAMLCVSGQKIDNSKFQNLHSGGYINIPKLDILWDVAIHCLGQAKIYQQQELVNIFIIRASYAINMPLQADIVKFLNDESLSKIMENFSGVKILK